MYCIVGTANSGTPPTEEEMQVTRKLRAMQQYEGTYVDIKFTEDLEKARGDPEMVKAAVQASDERCIKRHCGLDTRVIKEVAVRKLSVEDLEEILERKKAGDFKTMEEAPQIPWFKGSHDNPMPP